MANENTNPTTYADWAKTRDPDGSTSQIVELQTKLNPIISDIFVKMSNMNDGHQFTARANDPRGNWVGFNEGVQPSKSASRQLTERFGYLMNMSEVDCRLADLEDDKAAFMLSEASSIMRGMTLDHADNLFYGNNLVNPKRFMGIMPRYNSTSLESGINIVNAKPSGGQPGGGANTSIYTVTWGEHTAFEIFPKGTMAGLKMQDLGAETVYDANGGRFRAYRQMFEQWIGFCLKDWRACGRIAQIDSTALKADTINLALCLTVLQHRLRNQAAGQQVIYCNQDVYTWFDIQAQEKVNVYFTMREWAGQEIVHWRGIPIRMCESILSTEANVTGLTADDGAGNLFN